MHRGILIRQSFMVLDLALALALAFVAYVLISNMVDSPAPTVEANAGAVDAGPAIQFHKLATREEYTAIVESALFGDAGKQGGAATQVVEQTPTQTEMETTLPLKLWGTVALGSKDPISSANIEDTAKKRRDVYFVGELLMDGRAKLVEVRPREVVILNTAQNRTEILKLDDEKKKSPAKVLAKAEEGAPQPGPNTDAVTLNREEVQAALAENAEALLSIVPEMVTDEDGNVTGITADSISTLPMADKFGLQDGDELQQVNGVKIDSQEKIIEVLNKFKDVNTFRLKINRGGKAENLTFKLE